MAPYSIRKYQEQDREAVIGIFSKGLLSLVPSAFLHLLKQPRSILLLLSVPGALFVGSGSLFLSLLSLPGLLVFLWIAARYPFKCYLNHALHTDLRDIRKSYLSDKGSCFWVAESKGRVVGMMCACPAQQASRGQKSLELLNLSVSPEYQGQGIAQSLIQTVLRFAQEQEYDAVVLNTICFNYPAQRVYEKIGFWKSHEAFDSLTWRLVAMPSYYYEYSVPTSL